MFTGIIEFLEQVLTIKNCIFLFFEHFFGISKCIL